MPFAIFSRSVLVFYYPIAPLIKECLKHVNGFARILPFFVHNHLCSILLTHPLHFMDFSTEMLPLLANN